MVLYKAVLKDWHKRNCGGLSLSTEFEDWSDAKIEIYGIYLDVYDYTDMVNRLAVLTKNYCK